MPRFVKNKKDDEKDYKDVKYSAKKIKDAYKRGKSQKKFPTSINLPEETVLELKSIASKKGLPYQTLTRMLIIEGLEKLKKVA